MMGFWKIEPDIRAVFYRVRVGGGGSFLASKNPFLTVTNLLIFVSIQNIIFYFCISNVRTAGNILSVCMYSFCFPLSVDGVWKKMLPVSGAFISKFLP